MQNSICTQDLHELTQLCCDISLTFANFMEQDCRTWDKVTGILGTGYNAAPWSHVFYTKLMEIYFRTQDYSSQNCSGILQEWYHYITSGWSKRVFFLSLSRLSCLSFFSSSFCSCSASAAASSCNVGCFFISNFTKFTKVNSFWAHLYLQVLKLKFKKYCI